MMQQPINFLPESYRQRQRQRRSNARQSVLVVVLAGVLTLWWVFQAGQTGVLRREAQRLESQVRAARQQMSEVVKLRRQYKTLSHRVRVQRLLAQPLRHTEILATLGRLMPESVALMELRVETVRPDADVLKPKDSDEQSDSNDDEKKKPKPHEVRIEIAAMAPDDMAVANMLTALKRHELFNEVVMHYSREGERQGVIGRQCRIGVVVDLDRRFERGGEGAARGAGNATPRHRQEEQKDGHGLAQID